MHTHKPKIAATAVTLLLSTLFIFILARPAPSTAAVMGGVPQALPYLVRNVEVYEVMWSPPPVMTAVLDGNLYFSGNNGTQGFELWRSDGTLAGTTLVKDIYPGATGSQPFDLALLNNILYFTADDGVNGVELWRSDGTADGTYMVKDVRPGAEGSYPYGLVAWNGALYFSADDGVHGWEMWRSDGTAAGTTLLKDINPGPADSNAELFATLSGVLLMRAETDEFGWELWRTNGTEAGTVLVKDIRPRPDDANQKYPAVMNNVAYFNDDDGSGPGLWRTDGSDAGTYLVSPASHTDYPYGLTAVGNTLYFSAYSAGYGTELWKSDGTLAGTVMVKDINPGTIGSGPNYFTAVGNTLYFNANTDDTGSELWKSDGTETGTVMVKDIWPGTEGGNPRQLLAAHDRLYFVAADGAANGRELWQSDGTETGTIRLTDINPGAGSSNPYELIAVGDRLLFGADNGSSKGLWAVADPQTGPTFTVNTRSDADNGYCTLGHCSLREAINAANAQSGANSIIFAEAAHGTISPAAALPTISEDLNIGGPGVGYLVLNGALVTHQSLLRVNSGHLYLSGLTIWQGGSSNTPVGGALLAESQVTLSDLRFNENQAQIGGALALYTDAVLNRVEFNGNTAVGGNGGALVAYNGTVTIYNSNFSSNTAVQDGGAIYGQNNFLNIYTSDFNNNQAANGGAVYANVRPTMDRTIFNGNTATADGGAIYATSAGPAMLTNLLFTENSAAGQGNAFFLSGNAPAMVHTVNHVTIAAPERQPGTAVQMAATGTLNVQNSIIANHTTGLARSAGTLTENYNLFHDNETDRNGLSVGANSLVANPLFVSAADGLFQLTPGSPAVEAGVASAVTWDYNNRQRPQGSAPDIGFDELAQTAVTGPGSYDIGNTGVSINVAQPGDLANVQLVWIPLDHPGYEDEGDPTGQGGYWSIVGLNNSGQTATGFSLTLTLPYDYYQTNPTVCRWDGAAWDCDRHGLNATHVWRHNVTAFSDWAIGEGEGGLQMVYLPLVVRP
ncbi:MAG TPA: CSLREA domain-containing protein [Chloroflexota bacterium]|nr:CSLREA domain-containing protein [Chloroflexota bacterium]